MENRGFINLGIVFRRQNLTSLDVRFCRLKTVPAPIGLSKHWVVSSDLVINLFICFIAKPLKHLVSTTIIFLLLLLLYVISRRNHSYRGHRLNVNICKMFGLK